MASNKLKLTTSDMQLKTTRHKEMQENTALNTKKSKSLNCLIIDKRYLN